MKLADLVETSRRVAYARSRREKVARLAGLLSATVAEEIELATAYLTGAIRRERLGVGWAAIRAVSTQSAPVSTVRLTELDTAFDRIALTTGKGSTKTRRRLLGELFARLTAEEQRFVRGLLLGELRQGALDGLVLEAVAHAARVPVPKVRRAVMLAGARPLVARTVFTSGPAGLAQYAVQLFRPVLQVRSILAASRCGSPA